MNNLILLIVTSLLFSPVATRAQGDAFEKDLARMLELSGSAQMYDAVFDQMILQMKSAMPSVDESAWPKVKSDVWEKQIAELNQKLVPIYRKHFTHDDIKSLIAFYQTDIGKKLAEKTPLISRESMVIGQQWGMQLGQAIQNYLKDNGYVE